MILQALDAYYDRLCQNTDIKIPEPGFSVQKVYFELILSEEGELVQAPCCIARSEGKKLRPKELILPAKIEERTSGLDPHFLWDNAMYVLGTDQKGKPDRARKAFEAFRAFQQELVGSTDDIGLKSVLQFLDDWQPEKVKDFPEWDWDNIMRGHLVFRLDGENQYIHEGDQAKDAWRNYLDTQSSNKALCLARGESMPIARVHPKIKGVRGAQTSGAAVVSFNQESFISYGKEQSFNAPVSEKATFAYTTALNDLLAFDSRRKVQITDDTTVVFWAERKSEFEGIFRQMFQSSSANKPKEADEAQEQEQDRGESDDLKLFLDAVREGKNPDDPDFEPDDKFYVLGLSPNASRLSVRFWYVSTVEEMSGRIKQHFTDLSMREGMVREQDQYPSMWRLLLETAVQRKSKNISPVLSGALTRSFLTDAPYPRSLLLSVLNRIRADQEINGLRAAMIKAYLVRTRRINNNHQPMEGLMGLDKELTDPGYRLGRLFAVLEKAQEMAFDRSLNKTIKDRFYGTVSTTPRAVFPQLIKLHQNHIQKIKQSNVGTGVWLEKKMGEIQEELADYPAFLTLEKQGLFALGYYHQRQSFFEKSIKKEGE